MQILNNELNLETICPSDAAASARAAAYLDTLTKPPGSLGRLERLAQELVAMTGNEFPQVTPPEILVFAADHGVAEEGVSAFPQSVTGQMVQNFVQGGAAINVFARQIQAEVRIIDVGVIGDVAGPGVESCKVCRGSANLAREDAMTRAQARQAIGIGYRMAKEARVRGARCLIPGDMGIANTTASSAVLAVLTDTPAARVVGRGTGLDDSRLAHKIEVIEAAIAARCPQADDPLDVLAKLGGLEIAAMAGAYLGAAASRLPALVDGFIATVAALIATRLCPNARDYLIFAHRSQEPGHDIALAALQARPLLDLELRLGEGTGAALAFPLVEAASRMLAEMATFDSAAVDNAASSKAHSSSRDAR